MLASYCLEVELLAMPGKRNVLSHPLVNARLSQLRLATTNAKDFREVCHRVARDAR